VIIFLLVIFFFLCSFVKLIFLFSFTIQSKNYFYFLFQFLTLFFFIVFFFCVLFFSIWFFFSISPFHQK
jgi:hypothetical protein